MVYLLQSILLAHQKRKAGPKLWVHVSNLKRRPDPSISLVSI